LLLIIWLIFAGYVWFSSEQLPERVATHFGARGEPNGWMSREGHLRFMLFFGAALPVFILGLFVFIRRTHGWGLNIPHRDYWLAPERREDTLASIQRDGSWLAGLLIMFLAAIHYSIVAANAQTPAVLPMTQFIGIVGGFLLAMGAWSVVFLGRFFRRPPRE
jgi:uncharacterized membrane protein